MPVIGLQPGRAGNGLIVRTTSMPDCASLLASEPAESLTLTGGEQAEAAMQIVTSTAESAEFLNTILCSSVLKWVVTRKIQQSARNLLSVMKTVEKVPVLSLMADTTG
jgi:hypothetical protein